MNGPQKDEASKVKLELLLFQLSGILKDPPTPLDFQEWKENVEFVMGQIKDVSEFAHSRLDDLITEAVRRGEVHIRDMEDESPPNQTERSGFAYFEQVGFVTSEVNSLKSM